MVLSNPEKKGFAPEESLNSKKVGVSYRKELEEQLFLAAALVFSHYAGGIEFDDQKPFQQSIQDSDPDGLL